jgi:nucleoside 2-deoxyribosyltransferase
VSKVYLAGPITGTSYDGCTDWREYVQSQLPPSIEGVSPMRGKDHLRGVESIKGYGEHPFSTPKGITTRDRFDVTRCDAILVNFDGAQRVSIGTVMEIAWADMLRKPIVVVMGEDNPHYHAMIREAAGFIVPTLDEAIALVAVMLG